MKTDTCPLCGGERRLGWHFAVCHDCNTVQDHPDYEQARIALDEFAKSFRRSVIDPLEQWLLHVESLFHR